MRRFRQLTMLFAALAAASCRSETPKPPAATANGGTLVIAAPGDADLLLPPVTTTQTAVHVSDRLFPRLAEMKTDLNTVDDSGFVPLLARAWEHTDTTTIVFHLDPRARWQDGGPIHADDVVYTFHVYRDTLTKSGYRSNLDLIDSVTATDSLTVAFHFKRLYPEQLYDATYHLRILPKHLLDSIPDERLESSAFAKDPVGAGPYRFVHWEKDAEIALEADTTWFLGRPHLSRLIWRIVPDVTSAVSMLLAGEADAMEFIPLQDEIARVRNAADLRLVPYPSPFLAGIIFNVRTNPFADRDVRRAIAMAIDRQTIVHSLFGEYGDVPVGAASKMMWIAQGDVRQVPLDTIEAGRLLDARGWRRGADGIRRNGGRRLTFTVLTPTTSRARQAAATLVQAQLKAVGIDMQIQPLEYSVYDKRGRDGNFDAVMFSRTLDPSPADLVKFWGHGPGNENIGGYRSAAFDSLDALASVARSRAAAQPLWRGILELLNEDAPAVFLFSPRNNAAFHRRIEHVTIRPDSWLATVTTWSIAPDRRLPRDR